MTWKLLELLLAADVSKNIFIKLLNTLESDQLFTDLQKNTL